MNIRQKQQNGMAIVDIARENCEKTIRKWLRSNDTQVQETKRPSKLVPYKDYIMKRMAEGVFNCESLYREISNQGYLGGKTIFKDFVAPFRRQFRVQAV